MQQLISLWSSLEPRRKVLAILSTIALTIAVIGLSSMATSPNLSLLYAGLDGRQSADIVRSLDQQGVKYEVRGSSILVEARQRDQLRMTLAGEGLPSNSGDGYELLDGLTGFGTTSQMFDAAYWRAKEGELARTIVANPGISAARVHIANPSSSPFQRGQAPTASVTVTTSGLEEASAKALKFLVSSAVAGLKSDAVTIIDATTGRMLADSAESTADDSTSDRGAELKAKVERILEARVGFGKAIVEVSMETMRDSESIVERRFDPEGRVAISTNSEEISNSANNSGISGVTVASNLPSGDASAPDRESTSQTSEIRETTNFEVSETLREVTRTPGAIKRLTVAVLVDGIAVPDGQGGTTWQPRSDDELSVLHDLVASAVGFDEARGDIITLKTLEFDALPELGTTANSGFLESMILEPMRLIQLAVLSLVALALGLFVVRPILTTQPEKPLLGVADDAALTFDLDGTAVGVDGNGEITDTLALDSSETAVSTDGLTPIGSNDLADQLSQSAEDGSIGKLKTLIEERQPDTIEILKSWLEDDAEKEIA